MSNASALFRSLVIYGLCLPLAITLGYLLANPFEMTTFAVVISLLLTLLIPLFLRWHHPWLIAAWNMSAVVFFLPGHPRLWQVMALVSFGIAILQYTVNRKLRFLNVPSVTKPLLFLTAVVLITMRLTGGIGLKTLGSTSYGGKNYIGILTAVVGYFALTSRTIPPQRAKLYIALFFLSTATMAIGDLPVLLPSQMNFLYLVFPLLDSGNLALHGMAFNRLTGFSCLGEGVFAFMLARYGIRGIFLEPGKGLRPLVFVGICFISLLGGYRSSLVLYVMTFTVLFCLERLYHTRLLPVLLITGLLSGTLMVAFANRLPIMMQRALAILPINVDPAARLAAEASSTWRLEIWRNLLPQVPQYLILGKGYSFSARDLTIMQDAHDDQAGTELVGDYHNGPLSILIPFGIFGMIGFLWFLWAAFRVVYQNYQFGDPAYRTVNTFILAMLIVKVIMFFTVFGALVTDLMKIAGLIGFSISLNGGLAKPAVVTQAKVAFDRFKLHPSIRRPARA
jgi:hypothetical protein